LIWILRHGDAEDGAGKDDIERELTEKGERQARDAGRALKALGVSIDLCLTSPAVRARDTARLAAAELGVSVEEDQRLWGGDWDPFDLAAGRGDVILVGHEPDCAQAVAIATGSRLKMRKGGLAGFDDHILHALYSPKVLRAIAAG